MVYLVYSFTLFIFALLSFGTIHFSVLTYKRICKNQMEKLSLISNGAVCYMVGLLLFGYFFFQNLFIAIEWSFKNNFFATFSVSHGVFIGYFVGGVIYFIIKRLKNKK